MEKIRLFAEDCDYLSCINIHTDMDDGFAGLTCSLLPHIREDYGNNILVPVWGFSHANQIDSGDVKKMADKIHMQQLPLIYTGRMQLALTFSCL